MKFSGPIQSFLTHLDELRARVVKSAAVFFCTLIICFSFAQSVLDWLIKPAGHLVFTTVGGGFNATMSVAFIMAFIISAPFTLYQFWAFIAGALKPHERRYVSIYAPLSFVLFALGALFGFYVAVPMSYNFLVGFETEYLKNMISVDSYLSFVTNMVSIFAVTFELPLVLAFLAHIGIATPEFLRQKRRHAIMIIFILAAVLTPPDVVSQLLLAVPLVVLFEVGILFTKMFYREGGRNAL